MSQPVRTCIYSPLFPSLPGLAVLPWWGGGPAELPVGHPPALAVVQSTGGQDVGQIHLVFQGGLQNRILHVYIARVGCIYTQGGRWKNEIVKRTAAHLHYCHTLHKRPTELGKKGGAHCGELEVSGWKCLQDCLVQ